DGVISASLRTGFRGHRCQAEICTLRHGEHSTWCKLLNREYSQRDGREELFERECHSEPVAGWHLCDFRRSVSDRDNGGSGGESGGYCGTGTISVFNHVTLMSRHCSPLSKSSKTK